MLRTKIFPLMVVLGLLLSSTPLLAITAEAQQFHQGDISTENFKSPHRTNDAYGQPTIDVWPHINSAWNQPRNVVGTNPHEGTDLSMAANTPVYSVFEGTVVQRGTDWLLIKRTNQNVYMVYKHINPLKYKGDTINTTTRIATIQDISQDHLHIGLTTNNTLDYNSLIWAANNRPFNHVNIDNWYYGRGADFLKRHSISSGHVLNIYAFASDDANSYVTPLKVVLWHRPNGTTTWSGPVMMNAGSSYRYYYDFGNLGYYNNQKVDFLVVGYRDGYFPSGESNWAFYPGYYASPAEKPDSNSKFYTVTLLSLPEPL
jgi:hypothetical protein